MYFAMVLVVLERLVLQLGLAEHPGTVGAGPVRRLVSEELDPLTTAPGTEPGRAVVLSNGCWVLVLILST